MTEQIDSLVELDTQDGHDRVGSPTNSWFCSEQHLPDDDFAFIDTGSLQSEPGGSQGSVSEQGRYGPQLDIDTITRNLRRVTVAEYNQAIRTPDGSIPPPPPHWEGRANWASTTLTSLLLTRFKTSEFVTFEHI